MKTAIDNYSNKGTYKADVTNLDVAVSSRAVLNEYDNELADIQANQEIRLATIADTTPSNIKFITDLIETDNNYWNRGVIKFTSGLNEGVKSVDAIVVTELIRKIKHKI